LKVTPSDIVPFRARFQSAVCKMYIRGYLRVAAPNRRSPDVHSKRQSCVKHDRIAGPFKKLRGRTRDEVQLFGLFSDS
jgi:hypothetical protein